MELQLLDHFSTPFSEANVTVNGVPVSPVSAGKYTVTVEGPKAGIRIDMPERGLPPVIVEAVLVEGKYVYLEVCFDPDTGEVKNVFQKGVSTLSGGGATVVRKLGRGALVPRDEGTTTGVAPPNDLCASALPVFEGITPFDTRYAGTDGPNHPGLSELGQGETVGDVWFSYVATRTGTLTVSTCNDADFDTDLVVYSGTGCGALSTAWVAGDDDSFWCTGYTSSVQLFVNSGQELLIRVGGFGSFGDDSRGTGNLTLLLDSVIGVLNDDIGFAAPLALNATTSLDNSLATIDPADPPVGAMFGGPAQPNGSLWYTFVAADPTALLDTSASLGGDTVLAVYDGVPGSLVEIGASDDDGTGLLSQVSLSGLVPGSTYYVLVGSYDVPSAGQYELELLSPAPPPAVGRCCFPSTACVETTQEECEDVLGGTWDGTKTCADPCPPPPANDECIDAIPLTVFPANILLDNTGATDDIFFGDECGLLSGPFKNVWYSLVGTGTSVNVSTCRNGTGAHDTKLAVYCGDCIDKVCVAGNDDAGCILFNPFNSRLTFCAEAGKTYYITVGDFGPATGGGPIEMRVNKLSACTPTVSCDPIGACCLPDSTCLVTTLSDCSAQGGDFLGEGVQCALNAVNDGGFELGFFGGAWTEFSLLFGTPVCNLGACGTGGGTPPFEGSFWVWFGGISGIAENGFVEQSVVIPPGATTLDFYLDIPASSGNAVDFMDVKIDGNTVFSVLEGDPNYTAPGWQLVSVPVAPFNDGLPHLLRFESAITGFPGVTSFFLDDVRIEAGAACPTCVVLDFETEDDFLTPLVNGQDISTPPEFGNLVSISASMTNQGPAIFDTDPLGPNLLIGNDPDLLVDKGNCLIFQEGSTQTVPGIFDSPDDSSGGGTFFFDFNMPVEVRSLVLSDIDIYPLPQDAYVTLIDSSFNTRTYHAPSGWTEDIVIDGGTGYRTLDTTSLGSQPGFISTATVFQDIGFDPKDVIRMEVTLTSSGGVDDIEICF